MFYYLGLLGIAAFAITGVIAAGRKGMDIFSIVLFGGGTMRDLIINVDPIFWIADLSYLWVSVVASVMTFFLVRYVSHVFKLLLFVDAFGLALFTILAAEKTLVLGFFEPVTVLMGLVTGIAGGMIRDILQKYYPLHDFNRLYSVGIIFLLRGSAIQWGLYYPKWLLYSEKS